MIDIYLNTPGYMKNKSCAAAVYCLVHQTAKQQMKVLFAVRVEQERVNSHDFSLISMQCLGIAAGKVDIGRLYNEDR